MGAFVKEQPYERVKAAEGATIPPVLFA